MPPVRILHLITDLGAGGAETWLCRLLSRLPREGFDCRVVSMLPLDGPQGALAGAIRDLGVPVQSLGMRRGLPGPGGLLRLMELLRHWRPHVLQTWMYHADLLGLLAARACGCGAAVSWGLRAGYMDFSRYGLATRLTVRACARLSHLPQAVTANSCAGARLHVEALGYRPRRLTVLENGVDGEVFRPDAEAGARLRAEWNVPPGALLAGLVARVDAMKGHDVFCMAMRRVRERFPQALPVFCGQGTEPGAPELDALLARHGLAGAGAVRLGQRRDVPQVLAALDVLALPSLGEGFPNALAEGLACGVPVAALDVGDARRMVGPGGLLADAAESGPGSGSGAGPERRAAALAECLEGVLALTPEQRSGMGTLGRFHVLNEFGLDAAVARWAAHFESLAAESGSPLAE
ncbi:MAG: glycosyltransferase [Desulfovibrio sp.]|jgi:glycosyltransferase involved in cell wall biosynthesis|nr:glycosyltransferase [Desulfovibrio sp.]